MFLAGLLYSMLLDALLFLECCWLLLICLCTGGLRCFCYLLRLGLFGFAVLVVFGLFSCCTSGFLVNL